MWERWIRGWLNAVFWWLPRSDERPRDEPQERSTSSAEPSPAAEQPAEREPDEPEATEPAKARTAKSKRARSTTAASKPARSATAKPESTKAKAAKSGPAAKSGAKPAGRKPAAQPKAAASDPLTELPGVGPAMHDKLEAAGITTFADLARADADALTATLKPARRGLSRTQVQRWIDAARERG